MTRPGGDSARAVIAALQDLPRELRKESRPAFKRAGEPIRRDAASRASWSTRIPRALRIAVYFAARNAGLALRTSGGLEHARLFEFGQPGNRSLFRHPVFGNRDAWVSQPTRPFMVPAIRAGREDVIRELGEAVDRAARNTGWR